MYTRRVRSKAEHQVGTGNSEQDVLVTDVCKGSLVETVDETLGNTLTLRCWEGERTRDDERHQDCHKPGCHFLAF